MKKLFLISVLFLLLISQATCNIERDDPRGVVLETTSKAATFADRSFQEVVISALVKNVGGGGALIIHALVEPEGSEPVEDYSKEYFGKDIERRVFFLFKLESDVEFNYRVWTTQ